MGEARQYLELRGELSGALAPDATNVHQQMTIQIMSLPRCDDPPEVIEASDELQVSCGS